MLKAIIITLALLTAAFAGFSFWISRPVVESLMEHYRQPHWDQVLGAKPDGGQWIVPGLSILYYAGDGLFCYSHDYLNMTYIGETLKAMQWQPPEGFNMPPAKPDWRTHLPAAWQHLPDAFAAA